MLKEALINNDPDQISINQSITIIMIVQLHMNIDPHKCQKMRCSNTIFYAQKIVPKLVQISSTELVLDTFYVKHCLLLAQY